MLYGRKGRRNKYDSDDSLEMSDTDFEAGALAKKIQARKSMSSTMATDAESDFTSTIEVGSTVKNLFL